MATVVVATAVIAADQATTSWALASLHRREHLLGPLGLAVQYNSGTAFSLFSGSGDWIVAVVVVLLVAVCWLAWRARRTWVGVAYGLVLGGALGNLADRLFRDHHGDVVDFITMSHWPTFNIADAAITVGVVALIVMMLFRTPSGVHRSPRRAGAGEVPSGVAADRTPRRSSASGRVQ
ncbi:MAG: signal peptidase II [Acidimicrobiales bacterium]